MSATALASTSYADTKAAETVSAQIPAGTIFQTAATSAPTGWLFCAGQSLATASYAALWAAIGYTYGGSGANFNLPDLRGRTPAGKDDMGGTAANRLTSGGAGLVGTTLGATGGSETHTLTTPQIPAHTHTNAGKRSTTAGGAASIDCWAATGTVTNITNTTDSTGGGGAHPNVQPTIILNYIIKT